MKADRGGFYGRVRCAKSLISLRRIVFAISALAFGTGPKAPPALLKS